MFDFRTKIRIFPLRQKNKTKLKKKQKTLMRIKTAELIWKKKKKSMYIFWEKKIEEKGKLIYGHMFINWTKRM